MRRWEEIIRNRLDSYSSPIPESSFAEFLACADKVDTKRNSIKRMLLVAALAVGISTLLFIHKPAIQYPELVAENESTIIDTTANTTTFLHSTVQILGSRHMHEKYQEPKPEQGQDQTSIPKKTTVSTSKPLSTATASITVSSTALAAKNNTGINLSSAAIVGSGSIALLLAGITDMVRPNNYSQTNTLVSLGLPNLGSGALNPDNYVIQSIYHHPIKAGLSFSIPVTDRSFLSFGLNYSFYHSEFEGIDIADNVSFNRIVKAHYLSLPILINYIISDNKRLDIYLGTGLEPDYCLHSSGIAKTDDGIGLSVIAASGIQFNINRHIGLYTEPTLFWNIYTKEQTIPTYKKEHQVMFSISSGLRINLAH